MRSDANRGQKAEFLIGNTGSGKSVTLGALSFPKEGASAMRGKKRHPTLEDNVVVYSGATILGGNTVIGHHSVIGGNVWLTNSVPPYSRVYNAQPSPIIRQAASCDDSLN